MRRIHGWLALGSAAVMAAAALAADGTGAGGQEPAASQPAASQPSAEDAMHRLLGQMKDNPLIEPSQHPAGHEESPSGQTMRVGVDPNVIGVAPGGAAPTIRLEGEFVVNRKGRLSRSPDGSHRIFVFDADGEKSPEAPMILSPCTMLQSMEDLTEERGDRIRFILSGQILLYRGANYLLVTMYTLAEDHGNIQK